MSSTVIPASIQPRDAAALPQRSPGLRVYATEAKYEIIKQMRIPAFMVPTIGFPIMFYVLFGLVMPASSPNAHYVASYALATYGAFGVIGISLFALGVGVAVERGQGWLAVKRASPMPLSAYFIAKYVTTLVVGIVLMLLMCLIGAAFGHVRMPASQWALLIVAETLGAIPFCAMGLAIGYLAGPNSAAPVVNMIYLPMAFLSGLFIPVEMLPRALQRFALGMPPFHLGRLGLEAVGIEPGSQALGHVAALAGFGILFTIVAVIAYRRDEGKTYG